MLACRKFKRFPWMAFITITAGWRRIIYVPVKARWKTFDVDKLAENLRLAGWRSDSRRSNTTDSGTTRWNTLLRGHGRDRDCGRKLAPAG